MYTCSVLSQTCCTLAGVSGYNESQRPSLSQETDAVSAAADGGRDSVGGLLSGGQRVPHPLPPPAGLQYSDTVDPLLPGPHREVTPLSLSVRLSLTQWGGGGGQSGATRHSITTALAPPTMVPLSHSASRSSNLVERWVFVIVTLVGFIVLDMAYAAVVVNYSIQCQLMVYLFLAICDRMRTKDWEIEQTIKVGGVGGVVSLSLYPYVLFPFHRRSKVPESA